MRWLLPALMACTLVGCNASSDETVAQPNAAELQIVDSYIDSLALLALLPTPDDVRKVSAELDESRPQFEEAMTTLIRAGDRRAAARLVYSQVIQVGTFIEADSPLGKATRDLTDDQVRIRNLDGEKLIFAGDLYLWWKDHRDSGAPFDKLTRWEESEAARKSIIPMYESETAKSIEMDRDSNSPGP